MWVGEEVMGQVKVSAARVVPGQVKQAAIHQMVVLKYGLMWSMCHC